MAEHAYRDFPYIFSSKGIVARYAADRCPPETYLNLKNMELQQENALTSRLGHTLITTQTTPIPENIHTLARLKGIGTNVWRYAGAGLNIYRSGSNGAGTFSSVTVGQMSGSKFSTITYRPTFSAFPWIFFADKSVMLKDNGSLNPLQQMGIFPPTIPPKATVGTVSVATAINEFEVDAGFTYLDISAHSAVSQVSTTIAAAITSTGLQAVTPGSMTNIVVGSYLNIDTAGNLEKVYVSDVSASTFTANFTRTHAGGVAVADTGLSITNGPDVWGQIYFSGPFNLSTPGSTSGVYGAGDILSLLINPTDGANVKSLQVQMLDTTNTVRATKTSPVYTSGRFNRVTFNRSDFVPIAGTGSFAWNNVQQVNIYVEFLPAASSKVYVLNDFVLLAGGPDVTGGVPYDYRITYYNINSGTESNPSIIFAPAFFVSPIDQQVTVQWVASPDAQVTHVRIYRRGGTLPTNWNLIGQVAVGTTTFADVFSDAAAAGGSVLKIDNDVPVTVDLSVPVSTTIAATIAASTWPTPNTVTPASMTNIFPNQLVTVDTGSLQETVLVQSTTVNTFTAYFQVSHAANSQVSASTKAGQALNLATIAFQQVWLAGDPNNPNRLYYSKLQQPEYFPPQNYIEIGVPSDPIMAVISLRGQIFVFTLSRVYRILVSPGAVPAPYPTGSRHGLMFNFAWCIGESQIWYRSQDGIYVFTGEQSEYVSLPVEWLVGAKEGSFGSPLLVDGLNALNIAMAYHKNEIFYAYSNSVFNARLIYDTVYKRWRNDDIFAAPMLTEEDTSTLIFSRNYRFILQDRIGNVDQEFSPGQPSNTAFLPMPTEVQTPALDQGFPKNNKIYNEFTLDADSGDSPSGFSISLIFDLGLPTQNTQGPFTFINNGRTQIPYQINSGKGIVAKTVSVDITGGTAGTSTAKPITLYEWHIKAAVDAEFRGSFDTFWAKFGTDEPKICKQGQFEYVAADAAGITFNVYLEGDMNVSAFSFTLPQTTIRQAVLVRFPAFKGKLWRFVGTSASQFLLYGESFVEYKVTAAEKGYLRERLGQVISAQGSV